MTQREVLSALSASGDYPLEKKNWANVEHLCRYSGAGDELISPVYIAPTLPPYVERTWPEEEVKIFDDDEQM